MLSLVAVVGMLAGAKMVPDNDEQVKASLSKVNYSGRQVEEVIRFLESRYVNTVNGDSLVTKAINVVLKGLDPHTHYYSPSQKEELENKTSGSYKGIGVEVMFLGDTMAVLYPRPNSPAERAGLKAGDRILQVNEHNLMDTSLNEQEKLELVKFTTTSKINVRILPLNGDTALWKEIEKEAIRVPSIPVAYLIDSSTVYMKANRFTQTTYREFMDYWERFATKEKASQLILDLRDNPGGFLREAVNMLSQIIEEQGKLLVYTEGEHDKRQEYLSTGKIFYPIENIVVLINKNSASASEIVAGCVQDLDRGVVLGSQSYGKGLVQEQFNLSNGGTLRMTVSRYYTPSGRSIQKPYQGEHNIDTTAVFYTRANRQVYGGGGIRPDIVVADFIQWEDKLLSNWMRVFTEEAILYSSYSSTNTVSDIPKLLKSVEPMQNAMSRILSIVDLRFKSEKESMIEYLDSRKKQLETLRNAQFITRQVGEAGWYHYFNQFDPVVLKAREVIRLDPALALNLPTGGK